jgi:hypothetical protein
MTLFTRSRPKEVDEQHATKLGIARGVTFYEVQGAEYYEAGRVETADEGRSGDLLLRHPERIYDDRGHSISAGISYKRLVPVPAGTFAAERGRSTTAATPMRLADALDLPALAPRASWFAPTPAGAAPFALGKGWAGFAEGRSAIRGRAIGAFLEAQGYALAVHAGRLLVSAPRGNVLRDHQDIIERGERLLVGFVTGSPEPCELTHEDGPREAWTALVGGLLACEAHASGELAP